MRKPKKITNKFNIGDVLCIPVEVTAIYKNELLGCIDYRIRTLNMGNDVALKIINKEMLTKYRSMLMKGPDGEPITSTNKISEDDLIRLKEEDGDDD